MKNLVIKAISTSFLLASISTSLPSFASNNTCKEVEFSNGTICINIDQVSSTTYKISTDTVDGTKPRGLSCGILLQEDNKYIEKESCYGQFTTDDEEQNIKIYFWGTNHKAIIPEDREGKPSNKDIRTFPQRSYDFDKGERTDSEFEDEDNN
jgi:hypothetical protein